MAYRLIWSPTALADLHDIVSFIALNNPQRALSFGYQVIAALNPLPSFPRHGRVVPESGTPELREVIFRRYRIVYRIDHARELCEVVRIWHAARDVPNLEE